jgi:3-methyladenine DNA glycosylase AlkD
MAAAGGPQKAKKSATKPLRPAAPRRAPDASVQLALAELKRHGKKSVRDGMARYAISATRVFGVPVGTIRQLGKKLGRDHALALGLWQSGWYEARLLAAFVADPARITPAQMDRWCRTFDNWAVCDTACFHLFDRTPHAFAQIRKWAGAKEEFVKRAAFALLASVALHDKANADGSDAAFLRCLPLCERAATDDRNFVKKAVSWALRGVGRRSLGLNVEAIAVARRLVESAEPAARWVGRDVLKELTSPAVARRLEKRST